MKSMQDNDVWDLVELLEGILRLSQENYISKVLDRFGMKDSKSRDTLIAEGDKFSLKQCSNTLIAPSTMAAKFVACFKASNHGI
ncbi:hypothetical protein CR513_17286, partial [Mucuna pruriens]